MAKLLIKLKLIYHKTKHIAFNTTNEILNYVCLSASWESSLTRFRDEINETTPVVLTYQQKH